MDSGKKRKYIDKGIRLNGRPDVFLCVFLVLITVAVYWQVRDHEFIGYDDDNYVAENNYVKKGITSESVIWAFTAIHAGNWHPVTWLSHMLDVELFGVNAGAHHLVNLFFHILNSLLLFIVFKKMTSRTWQSAFMAFLFALHPLHVESVAWVAERRDVLSTFFWLLTIWSYARFVRRPVMIRYAAVAGFFTLGLMAKPMVVTLPFVLLLLDYWPLNRFKAGQTNDPGPAAGKPNPAIPVLRLVSEKIPLFVLTGLSCGVTVLAQKKGEALGLLDVHPLTMRVANAIVSYLKYLQKLIWPTDLAILYPYPEAITAGQVLVGCAVLGTITFLAVRYGKRLPWLFVGWFWYLGTLVPVIGLVQVGVQAMADRYTYVPFIGLYLVMTWGASILFDSWRYKKTALSVIGTVIISAMITITWVQVGYWKNSVRLFEHALKVTSGNYVIHNNLGFELVIKGQTDRALEHYKQALRINPEFELAHVNLGSVLFAQAKIDESFAYYQTVLKARPRFARVHYNFGILLLKVRRVDEAIFQFQEALRIKSEYAEAHNSLGAAMVSKKKIPEAIGHFKTALEIKPSLAEARANLEILTDYISTDAGRKINIGFE
jgi:tetratricopeptide (TPR) repeat protein